MSFFLDHFFRVAVGQFVCDLQDRSESVVRYHHSDGRYHGRNFSEGAQAFVSKCNLDHPDTGTSNDSQGDSIPCSLFGWRDDTTFMSVDGKGHLTQNDFYSHFLADQSQRILFEELKRHHENLSGDEEDDCPIYQKNWDELIEKACHTITEILSK